jgi:hypothetical protein
MTTTRAPAATAQSSAPRIATAFATSRPPTVANTPAASSRVPGISGRAERVSWMRPAIRAAMAVPWPEAAGTSPSPRKERVSMVAPLSAGWSVSGSPSISATGGRRRQPSGGGPLSPIICAGQHAALSQTAPSVP